MEQRPLGNRGPRMPRVGVVGFGSFKIGRNQKIKYAHAYDLPSDADASQLLNAVLDLGVNYIDTAPAYGLAEQRIGQAIAHRRDQYTLATKVGEAFEGGESRYDFSAAAITASVERSLRLLRTDAVDVLLIHSDGRDEHIQRDTDAVATLQKVRDAGKARLIGLSGKTVAGAMLALDWADAVMVEYHADDTSHEPVIAEAASRGVGVIVKKALASGRLDPAAAIRFVTGNPHVATAVIGTLNIDHLRKNIEAVNRHEGT